MNYSGQVKNGAIVLDAPVTLKEGARVRVELMDDTGVARGTTLRGAAYRFDDPFSPVLSEEDWEASR